DVQELIWSLGGVAFADQTQDPTVFDITFEVPAQVTPCNGPLEVAYEPTAETLNLHISQVEHVRNTEQVCITVAAENHLYVSGDYVVTHNTFFAQNFATQCVLSGVPVFFINPKAADPLSGLVDYINE